MHWIQNPDPRERKKEKKNPTPRDIGGEYIKRGIFLNKVIITSLEAKRSCSLSLYSAERVLLCFEICYSVNNLYETVNSTVKGLKIISIIALFHKGNYSKSNSIDYQQQQSTAGIPYEL